MILCAFSNLAWVVVVFDFDCVLFCNFVVKVKVLFNMDGAYDGNYGQSDDQSMTKKRGIEDADDDA